MKTLNEALADLETQVRDRIHGCCKEERPNNLGDVIVCGSPYVVHARARLDDPTYGPIPVEIEIRCSACGSTGVVHAAVPREYRTALVAP
jgi:hypothetical protein